MANSESSDTAVAQAPDDELGAGPASSLLLGQVSTESPVSAVMRRLRAAIALGLLGEGDRLPREADLARGLGVTMFSVRQALGTLRDEGLLTTKAGKNGGSFISYGTDRTKLGSIELLRMSSTELRDLCDWRQMLVAESAALAAQRASTSNVGRLRRQAERLSSAQTELEARRAHGRFHVELAAAAQSARMTRAELAMFEEFDWLLGTTLSDGGSRSRAADGLAAVADAVAARSSDEARSAASRHSAFIVDALLRSRLASIAGQADSRRVDDQPILEEILQIIDSVLGSLDTIASGVEKAMPSLQSKGELRGELSRAVVSAAADVAVEGLGYIAEPAAIPDSEYVIAWWRLTSDGLVVDNSHVLDPGRDDFYDYTTQEYYTVPKSELRPHAQGPYVDFGGTNDYSITFSRPLIVEDEFVGVAAADISVATIERHLAPWLSSAEHQYTLINAERRVIVSNVADNAVGDVLPAGKGPKAEPIAPVGWYLIEGWV